MSAQSQPFTTAGAGNEGHDPSSDRRYFVDRDASIGSLAKELLHEVPALLTKELALAKSEMRESLSQTKEGLIAASTGGVVLMGGYLVLLFAAVYGLSLVMAPWLAALIVGGVAAVIGYIMVSAGMRQFRGNNLRPDHTINSLRKDTNVIRGRTQ